MVGVVRWSRNHPRIKENPSGGVGMVRGKWRGILDAVHSLSVRVYSGPPSSTFSKCVLFGRTIRVAQPSSCTTPSDVSYRPTH